MDLGLTIARVLTILTTIFLPLSLILLPIGIIIDIWKRKFHWSKFALIFFAVTIVLLLIQFKLIYSITGGILNN